MKTTNKRVAIVGMGLIAGLTAAAACAPLEPNEPGTGTARAALNANPARTAGTALASTHERSFGASCALWDTDDGVDREVVISAFGYKGTTPDYLNTFDLYDSVGAWVANGTVSGGGNTATAAAYVAAVTGPETSGGHLNTCYFLGGYDGSNPSTQAWKATVVNHVVTWTKLTSMNVARAKFGVAVVGDSPNQKLMAVGGGFGGTRTNTIERFDFSSTWTTETTSTKELDQAVHSFGFLKLSDTKLVVAGGDGATNNPSGVINAIKVDANGAVVSVGKITNSTMTARKDNIVLPTGKTGLTSGEIEILVAMGQDSAGTPALVTAAERLRIDWTSTPAYVSGSIAAGAAPNSGAFPTVVDAYLSPKNATNNRGYLVLGGVSSASPQVAIGNGIQKFNPSTDSTSSGTWGTAAAFATAKTGVNAVYVKSIDEVIVSGGADRWPSTASATHYLSTDRVQ